MFFVQKKTCRYLITLSKSVINTIMTISASIISSTLVIPSNKSPGLLTVYSQLSIKKLNGTVKLMNTIHYTGSYST